MTITQISTVLDVPAHRIAYVVKTRAIPPAAWHGHCRVFDEASVRRIAGELRLVGESRPRDIAGAQA